MEDTMNPTPQADEPVVTPVEETVEAPAETVEATPEASVEVAPVEEAPTV